MCPGITSPRQFPSSMHVCALTLLKRLLLPHLLSPPHSLYPSLLSPVSVRANWGKCAKLPYLGHTNSTAQFTWDSTHPTLTAFMTTGYFQVMALSVWICHRIQWANCSGKRSSGFTTPPPQFRDDHVASQHSCKVTVKRASGSIEAEEIWLFKKWQREILISCTRTDRAAAVTFNGII